LPRASRFLAICLAGFDQCFKTPQIKTAQKVSIEAEFR
jgi:hypothetical protein